MATSSLLARTTLPLQIRGSVAPLQKINKLALLDHSISTPLDPAFRTGTALQTQIDSLPAQFNGMRFAVVDLTDIANPALALNKHANLGESMGFAASMAKIAAMFTAFQLRHDLNVLSESNMPAFGKTSFTTLSGLFDAARRHYRLSQQGGSPVTTLRASGPVVERHDRLLKVDSKVVPLRFRSWNPAHPNRHDGAPNLENIFEKGTPSLSGALQVQFKKTPNPVGSIQGKHANASAILKLPFFERMLMMIDESDNSASASVILDLGYLYISSCLMQSGLYDVAANGGLWLGASYPAKWARAWAPSPVDFQANNRSQKFQASSAVATVKFLTLLEQGKLVSPSASTEMLDLLERKTPARSSESAESFTWRDIRDQLGLPLTRVAAKIGIGKKGGLLSDCAIIEQTVSGKNLKYAYATIAFTNSDFQISHHLLRGVINALVATAP